MSARRRGFTLVELLVVMVLGAVVMGAIYKTLVVQERTARRQSVAIATQQDLRVGLQVLAAELREVSATANADQGGSDLLEAEAHRIRFRAFRDVGVLCEDPGTANLEIWVLAGTFEKGDSLLVFADGVEGTSEIGARAGDHWEQAKVSGVNLDLPGDLCPDSWGSYHEADIDLATGSDMSEVHKGALVRSFEVLEYGLFEIDGEWMLGRIEDPGGSDPDTIPLVGPLTPLTNNDVADDGVNFRYFGTDGDLLSPPVTPSNVGRIEITLRAKRAGGTGEPYTDVLSTQVYLRNN